MVFASKTPHDLLLTDEDWAAINRGDYCEEELVGIIPSKFHNPPNPILVAVRSREVSAREVLDAFAPGFDQFAYTLSVSMIDHARRVLTRLANLTKEQA